LDISSLGMTSTFSQFSLNIQPAIASNSRDSFVIMYRRIQDSVPTRVVTRSSSFYSPSLERCATYVIQVQRRCGQFNFSTMRIDTARTSPPLSTLSIRDTLNGLNLYLQANDGRVQDSFEVQYRKTAETNWASSSVASTPNWSGIAMANLRLPRLAQCTPYLIRARLKCSGGFSGWKEMNFYSCDTVPCNTSSLRVTVGQDSLMQGFVTVSPVVAFDTITITVKDARNDQYISSSYSTIYNLQNTFTIPNLVACTPYYVEVSRQCTRQGISNYTTIPQALTIRNANCPGGNCTEIATMTARDSSIGTVVSVSPNLNMPSDSFEVRYRKENIWNWSALRIYGSSPIVLPRLDSCANYKIQVRRKCGTASYSTWKEIIFRRPVSCLQDGGAGIRNPEMGATGDFALYPIPTNEVLNLNYELSEAGSIRFDILNLQGQLVQTIALGSQEKGSYQHQVSDLSALPSGFYLMTMRVNRKVVAMRKWQKF
jgi:Secretion system C-terminal sorting domain